MMNNTPANRKFIAKEINDFISSKDNLYLATWYGDRIRRDDYSSRIGILADNLFYDEFEKKYLFGMFSATKKYESIKKQDLLRFVGMIDLNGNKKYEIIFYVYGEDYLQRAQRLAKALSAKISISIEVMLAKKRRKFEHEYNDNGM